MKTKNVLFIISFFICFLSCSKPVATSHVEKEGLDSNVVFKLAKFIELDKKDSVYTLTITQNEAEKYGIDERHYKAVEQGVIQLNEIIVDYNSNHSPDDYFELTDFKELIKELEKRRK